jgi:SAM-dependent methyltransferase
MASKKARKVEPCTPDERLRAVLVDADTLAPTLPTPEGSFTDLAPPDAGGFSPAQRLMEEPFYSRGYERWFRPSLTRLVTPQSLDEAQRLSVQLLGLDGRETVLDIACGTGNFTRAIASVLDAESSLVVGLDLSVPMLREAVAKAAHVGLRNVRYVRGDALRLPVASASCDRVHCAGAFHLMPNPPQAVLEMARVVKPGGIVLIGSFVRSRGLRGTVESAAVRLTGMRFFERRDLHGMSARAGLSIEREIQDGAAYIMVARRPL